MVRPEKVALVTPSASANVAIASWAPFRMCRPSGRLMPLMPVCAEKGTNTVPVGTTVGPRPSLAEGVIEKDQFTARMNRTKARITEIDAKVSAQTSDEDRQLSDADWTTKREIIRALVQRIEIGPPKVGVVLRLPTDSSAPALDPIMVILSRTCAKPLKNRASWQHRT